MTSKMDLPTLDNVLALERLSATLFRASNFERNTHGFIFGGSLLGQAMAAAEATVEDRAPSFLTARFFAPGRADAPVDLQVDTIRDGRSIAERRITARQQGGRVIFEAAVSFHADEAGIQHHMPPHRATPQPEELIDVELLGAAFPKTEQGRAAYFRRLQTIDVRLVDPEQYFVRQDERESRFWIRAREPVVEASPFAVLAFLADFLLPISALLSHTVSPFDGHFRSVTLNHTMWFHDRPMLNNWYLHETDSPWAGKARGLSRGRMYAPDGRLLASTAQELLVRGQPAP